MELNQQFWENRYQKEETPWALNVANPALIEYISDKDKKASILIPGAGTSLEVIELLNRGFENITLCDISLTAVKSASTFIRQEVGDQLANKIQFVHDDFFEIGGEFDYIVEQTFFCALSPELRTNYVEKMYSLLLENGTLFGVLFDKQFDQDGPPFGGEEFEYKSLFSKLFYIKEMSICSNSVKPRAGTELFFICKKIVKPKI
ncbi:MAG: hypothetical protein WAT79_09765 [Saprospiraceae bacterium]